MQIKKLLTDENAVSPVIGVILMVAITVILAAVIGTFVLGLGDQVQNTSPQASFSFDFTDNSAGTADELEVVHNGGDAIDATLLKVAVSGATAEDVNGNSYAVAVESDTDGADTWQSIASGSPTEATAGSTITVSDSLFEQDSTSTNDLPGDYAGSSGDNEHVVLDGATVRMVWSSQSGDNSATLGKWSGPDA